MRIFAIIAAIVAPTAAIVGGMIWWQDRPLHDISARLNDGEFPRALELADEFLARHPQDLRAQLLRARALSALGRHVVADTQFQRIALQCQGFPDDIFALRAWSVSLLHLKKWTQAVSVLETLSNNVPADPEALYRLSVARIRLRQYDAALDSARRLAAIPGHEEQAYVMIGTIHHDRGNRRTALDAWEIVLKRNPEGQNLQISAGEFLAMVGGELLELGFPERAAGILERSAASRPAARTYALLGKAYSQTARLQAAVEAWKEALHYESRNSTAREELANAALREGRPKHAIDLMLPLTTTDDLSSRSAYVLQRAYTQLAQSEEAERWQRRAKALREAEQAERTVNRSLQNSTDRFWSAFLHAYQLAQQEKWNEAESIIRGLHIQRPNEPMLQSLTEAIQQRGTLPSLDDLKMSQE